MTQHTPGPLTAYVNDTEGSHVINEATGYIVCEQHDNEADAILHAAAPAMLDALRELTESLVNALNRITMLDGGITDENEELVRWGEARIDAARKLLTDAEDLEQDEMVGPRSEAAYREGRVCHICGVDDVETTKARLSDVTGQVTAIADRIVNVCGIGKCDA
tara:strand:+ start:56 stop:544 length:489 start_codon:yes stop_codon:yes gene_type:complete